MLCKDRLNFLSESLAVNFICAEIVMGYITYNFEIGVMAEDLVDLFDFREARVDLVDSTK